MAASDLLTLIEAVIAKRLAGDAVESYTEQQNAFRGTPLEKLFEIRQQLQIEANADGGGNFRLVEFA